LFLLPIGRSRSLIGIRGAKSAILQMSGTYVEEVLSNLSSRSMPVTRFQSYLVIGCDHNTGGWLVADPAGFCRAVADLAVMPSIWKSHGYLRDDTTELLNSKKVDAQVVEDVTRRAWATLAKILLTGVQFAGLTG